jgi:LysM repeat protein
MSLVSNLYTLSNVTATEVVPTWHSPQQVQLHNMTKSSNEYIYLGPSTVTTANSIHIDPGETVTMTIWPGDTLWAVSDPNGLELGVLISRT